MAKNLTDTAAWAAVQTPEPGDDVTADVAAAGDIQEALQRLVNRDRFLLSRLSPWGPPASVYCGDAAQVTVEGAASLDTNYAIAGALSTTPGALGNNKWYYLYAASGPTLQVSETAPDDAAVASSADAALRYCASFRTNGSAAILSFGANRHRYLYDTPINVLTAGTAGSWTSIGLSAQVPPTARAVRLRIFGANGSGAANSLTFQVKASGADAGAAGHTIEAPGQASGINGTVTTDLVLRLSATKALQYKSNSASLAVSIWVLGYDE